VPEELDKLEQAGSDLATRDFNVELNFKRGDEDAHSGFNFQAWFNSWHDFGFGIGLNTPWFEIVLRIYFNNTKGGGISFAAVRLAQKILATKAAHDDGKADEKDDEDEDEPVRKGGTVVVFPDGKSRELPPGEWMRLQSGEWVRLAKRSYGQYL
jgi:hypothetical protein